MCRGLVPEAPDTAGCSESRAQNPSRKLVPGSRPSGSGVGMERISPRQAGALRQMEQCSHHCPCPAGSLCRFSFTYGPQCPSPSCLPQAIRGTQGEVGEKCKEDEPQGKVKTEL